MRAGGFDVVLLEVLTPTTAAAVRDQLPDAPLLVGVAVHLPEAQRRAVTRRVWLTEQEFTDLHGQDAAAPPPVDVPLEVAASDAKTQQASVEAVQAART